ncbi:hypothetical protein C2S51_007157 [Perilla frutescens var. frutescens]|nr:hypothetical protein C2S51_007157 [Perilla frutescens var. frutescens]
MSINESFYDYWCRFQSMLIKCPQHQITYHDLIQYFVSGLRPQDKIIVNASCGESILNKLPTEAFRILAEMANENRDESAEGTRTVLDAGKSTHLKVKLERILDQMEKVMNHTGAPKKRVCRVCKSVAHFTDECPTLQEEDIAKVNSLGGYNNNRRYDSHSQTYNPGWRDHENFRWKMNDAHQPDLPPPSPRAREEPSLAKLVHALAKENVKSHQENERFKQETRAGLQHMSKQISQLAQDLAQLKERNGQLLSQVAQEEVAEPTRQQTKKMPPFPERLAHDRKEEKIKDLLKLCTKKVQFEDDARLFMGENVSTVLQKIPKKCEDPGMFVIPCIIGSKKIEKVMLDLGASINVMPMTIYEELNLGPLKETRVIIQLVDRSNVYPEGLIEDVLVKVGELIFRADFYVLDMGNTTPSTSVLVLGRPFMKTARTKINIDEGTLTCELNGQIVVFNIYEAMKYPRNPESVHLVNHCYAQSQAILGRMNNQEPLEWALQTGLTDYDAFNEDNDTRDAIMMLYSLEELLHGVVDFNLPTMTQTDRMLPSVQRAPKLELKNLPDHLKYAYLGENETLPLIVADDGATNGNTTGDVFIITSPEAFDHSKKVIHALMTYEMRVSDCALERWEAWFQIHHSQLRFGSSEYNLASDLQFSGSTFDPNGQYVVPLRAVYHCLFQGQRSTIREMEERSEPVRGSMDVGSGGGCGAVKFISMRSIFLPYVDALHEPPLQESRGYERERSRAISFLWVWACEVIPELARETGVHSGQLTLPQCLRWTFSRPTTDLATLF